MAGELGEELSRALLPIATLCQHKSTHLVLHLLSRPDHPLPSSVILRHLCIVAVRFVLRVDCVSVPTTNQIQLPIVRWFLRRHAITTASNGRTGVSPTRSTWTCVSNAFSVGALCVTLKPRYC